MALVAIFSLSSLVAILLFLNPSFGRTVQVLFYVVIFFSVLSVSALIESAASIRHDDFSPKLIFVHGFILALVTMAFFAVIKKI